MPWGRLDDHYDENPKIAGLSDRAFRADIEGICYANRNLTDGFLPQAVVDRRWKRATAELVAARRWEPAEGGYRIHDALEYSPSRADVEAKRRSERERKSRHGGAESERNPDPRDLPPSPKPIPSLTALSPSPNPKPGPAPIALRARDEAWEVLCEVTSVQTEDLSAERRKALNGMLASLKRRGGTADEIRRRAGNWGWDVPLTPEGLVKRWAELEHDRRVTKQGRVATADRILAHAVEEAERNGQAASQGDRGVPRGSLPSPRLG